MTLRTLFAFLGLLMAVSATSFLIMFRPPDKLERSYKSTVRSRQIWWLSVREYLVWLALALGGWRLVIINIANAERPIIFDSWIDQSVAIGTISIGAAASCVSFAVYLAYRKWDKEPDK